jgi:chromosome transmission fidelity protein 1
MLASLEQHSSGLPAVLSGTACTKVYYASRTHSQLAQILPELRRLKLASLKFPSSQTHLFNAEARNEADASLDPQAEQAAVYTRTVSLASRKQLCINDSLRAAVKDLDEGCRALLGGSSARP